RGVRSRAGGILLAAALAACLCVPVAGASQLIDRNASAITLLVNAKGEALLGYRAHGRVRHVLAWGAVNAVPSAEGARQVEFKLDYSGGWGKYYLADPDVRALQSRYRRIRYTPGYLVSPTVRRLSEKSAFARNYWRDSFHGSCAPYDGPALSGPGGRAKRPRGGHWGGQSSRRALADPGMPPEPGQAA